MKQIKLSVAIDEYVYWATPLHARNTVNLAKTVLKSFLKSTGDIYVHNIERKHVDTWFAKGAKRELSARSHKSYVSRLRMFFEYCREIHAARAGWDPVGRRPLPRPVRPTAPLYVPVERFPDLLDAAPNPRDRGVIAFGLYTLCRLSEMRLARIGDLDFEEGWVYVRIQKTGGQDRMPISTELAEEMQRWLAVYRKNKGGFLHRDWKLFPAREVNFEKDEHNQFFALDEARTVYVTDRAPRDLQPGVQTALSALGFPTEGSGGHTLRRSGARARFDHLSGLGYDGAMRDVQALLHHASIVTTEGYLGLSLEIRNRDDSIRHQSMYGRPSHATLPGAAGSAPRRLRSVQ